MGGGSCREGIVGGLEVSIGEFVVCGGSEFGGVGRSWFGGFGLAIAE